jgi:hypothetical protein
VIHTFFPRFSSLLRSLITHPAQTLDGRNLTPRIVRAAPAIGSNEFGVKQQSVWSENPKKGIKDKAPRYQFF